MQCMLNICTDFGTEYNAKFNENKSVALRIGPRFNSVCKPFVLGSRCLQFVDSVKYLGVCIVASHRFKCSFEDYKLKFVFVYLTAFLLRVKQPVQKLYRCTYSSRIVYPIWRMHVKLYHSIKLIFIEQTIWMFVHYAGFLKCILEKILTACVTNWMCLVYPSFLNQGSKDLWINSLIWTIFDLF